jgi:hypothetical protein
MAEPRGVGAGHVELERADEFVSDGVEYSVAALGDSFTDFLGRRLSGAEPSAGSRGGSWVACTTPPCSASAHCITSATRLGCACALPSTWHLRCSAGGRGLWAQLARRWALPSQCAPAARSAECEPPPPGAEPLIPS